MAHGKVGFGFGFGSGSGGDGRGGHRKFSFHRIILLPAIVFVDIFTFSDLVCILITRLLFFAADISIARICTTERNSILACICLLCATDVPTKAKCCSTMTNCWCLLLQSPYMFLIESCGCLPGYCPAYRSAKGVQSCFTMFFDLFSPTHAHRFQPKDWTDSSMHDTHASSLPHKPTSAKPMLDALTDEQRKRALNSLSELYLAVRKCINIKDIKARPELQAEVCFDTSTRLMDLTAPK